MTIIYCAYKVYSYETQSEGSPKAKKHSSQCAVIFLFAFSLERWHEIVNSLDYCSGFLKSQKKKKKKKKKKKIEI